MAFNFLCAFLISFVDLVSSQRISEILSANSQLSSLATQLESFPSLAQKYAAADNFTFLAPNNAALLTWLSVNRSRDEIQATLEYHLLNGTYPTAALSSTPDFIPTSLTNASFSNVTGGQIIEAFNKKGTMFQSGLNTTSNVVTADIIATGGIAHVIDTVLELPVGSIETISAENLSYFIEIGNRGDFLSVENRPYIDAISYTPDLTCFLPNSAKALTENIFGLNQDMLAQMFQYHCLDQLMYSTSFFNGTQLMTAAEYPVLVTINDGDIYINTAKITGRDNLVVNGVYHVIDDLLSPNNITRPVFAKGISTGVNSTAPALSTPTHTGTKVGVGVGAGVAIVAIIAALVLLCRRSRRKRLDQAARTREDWKEGGWPSELSSNASHEMHSWRRKKEQLSYQLGTRAIGK